VPRGCSTSALRKSCYVCAFRPCPCRSSLDEDASAYATWHADAKSLLLHGPKQAAMLAADGSSRMPPLSPPVQSPAAAIQRARQTIVQHVGPFPSDGSGLRGDSMFVGPTPSASAMPSVLGDASRYISGPLLPSEPPDIAQVGCGMRVCDGRPCVDDPLRAVVPQKLGDPSFYLTETYKPKVWGTTARARHDNPDGAWLCSRSVVLLRCRAQQRCYM
jgi:hypothetical protein